MEIKFASKEDAHDIAELYKQWGDYEGILPDKLVEPDSYEGIIKYLINKNSARKYIIAEEDDKIVGVCYIDVSFLDLRCIRLGDMIVHKEYRKQGIGSAILKWIINYSNQNKIKKIWMWAQEELVEAIKLYEKNGFVLEGRQKAQFCGKDALVYGFVLK
jgi:GNAT superfamily N-acetyltransferase